MDKIAIVSDSTCDLDKSIIEKYKISIIPLRIIYSDNEYLDGIEISPEEVYKRFNKEIPTTSLPSRESISSVFDSLIQDGYNKIICITISSGLSGTNNIIRLVANEYADSNVDIVVYDSKSISMIMGMMVEEVCFLRESGFSFDEIVNSLDSIKKRGSGYFVVSTLKYLRYGGRIGLVAGTIGELLNIKPIISINKDGIYYTVKKVKGHKKALSELVNCILDVIGNSNYKICVLHGGALEEGKLLLASIPKLSNILDIRLLSLSPVAGVHAGPNFLGIALFKC